MKDVWVVCWIYAEPEDDSELKPVIGVFTDFEEAKSEYIGWIISGCASKEVSPDEFIAETEDITPDTSDACTDLQTSRVWFLKDTLDPLNL